MIAVSCLGASGLLPGFQVLSRTTSFCTFGKLRGFPREAILKFTSEWVAPIVGAGAGLGRILKNSNISGAPVGAGFA